LFWAPAERQETGPRRPEERIAPGRHALFSGGMAAPAKAAKKSAAAPAARGSTGRSPALTGTRRAPVRPVRPARVQPAPVKRSPAPPERHGHGPISLSCSKCGIHTDVDIVKYLVLHLPWWLWRPGRGYTSLMKCPACHRRAWVSASWGPGEH
jgi:hypothetical protein